VALIFVLVLANDSHGLYEISKAFQLHGKSCERYGLPSFDSKLILKVSSRTQFISSRFSVQEHRDNAEKYTILLNDDQQIIYRTIAVE
jgi:hypothetical protein